MGSYLSTASPMEGGETTSESPTDNLNEQTNRPLDADLHRIHEKRRLIMAQKKQEFEELRNQVSSLQQENNILRAGGKVPDLDVEQLRSDNDQLKRSLEQKEASEKTLGLDIECIRKENEDLKRLLENKDKTYSVEMECLERENTDLKRSIEEKDATMVQYMEIIDKNRELRVQIAEMHAVVQNLNEEVFNFEKQRQEYNAHVVALKEVIKVSKQMIQIREAQLKELKEKVENIESTLADREINMLSQDLRAEYERQIQNIRNLKILYEERQRADAQEKRELNTKLEETTKELEETRKASEEVNQRVQELEAENSKKYDEIKSLSSDLGLSQAECRDHQAELAVINQLFSEILLGFNNTQDIDLDKMKRMLEENHGLLQNIVVNEISKEVSYALPKLLLDLVYQVDEKNKLELSEDFDEKATTSETSSMIHQLNSVDEIAENLPKVWKVLIELLSHQKIPSNEISAEENTSEKHCYKMVDTPKGPNLVASVSQTYIRLKDLILEKKALEKDTNNLKQLNTHLESRLQDQEKRLETVTSELSKTWHVVGNLQKQHQLLHTQEKILRYELAQKRKLLGELREELEYSREKWQEARAKNSTTEREWKQLRQEFASRRNLTMIDDSNNSCESGYSDDREGSSDDEPEYETEARSKGEVEESGASTSESQESEKEVVVQNEETEQVGEVIAQNEETEQVVEAMAQNEETEVEVSTELVPECAQTSTTNQDAASSSQISFEQRLAARDERLKRLELEATALVTKITNTNLRSDALSNKLDDLHPPEEVASTSSANAPEEPPPEENNGDESGT